MENNKERYQHWLIGDNYLFPGQEYLVKLDPPAVSIRFQVEHDAFFGSFEKFFAMVADVQWLSGHPPPKAEQEKILIEAWNFLALTEANDKGEDYYEDY